MKEKDTKKVTKTESGNLDFSDLAKYTNIGNKRDSIYKEGVISGTEKQRKAARRKIRNSRDKIVEVFNAAKQSERKEIAKAWVSFAKKTYKDISIIFESNTTDDKAILLAEFVANVKALTKDDTE